MVTLKDIAVAINSKILSAFTNTPYSNAEIQSTDIKEGFNRPCFYLELDGTKRSNFNSSMVDRNITARIYYFPSDRNKYRIELLEVQEILENTFINSIRVNENFAITIDEINSDVTDGILQTSFDLYTVEIKDDTDESEQMEELEYN